MHWTDWNSYIGEKRASDMKAGGGGGGGGGGESGANYLDAHIH